MGGNTDGVRDVFMRDRVQGTTERIRLASVGSQGRGVSERTSIRGDGRSVAFESEATN